MKNGAPQSADDWLVLRPARDLSGHEGAVCDLRWSPDGTLLASASRDGTVRLWSSANGVLRAKLRGHQSWVKSVCWVAGGRMIATGSRDQTVRLWDVDGVELRRFAHAQPVEAVFGLGATPQLAAVTRDRVIHVWDADCGEPVLRSSPRPGLDIAGLGCDPVTGSFLAAWSDGGLVGSDGSRTEVPGSQELPLRRIAWSADRTLAGLCGSAPEITVVDWRTGRREALLERLAAPVQHLAFSQDGRFFGAQCTDGVVHVWSGETWRRVAELKTCRTAAETVRFALHPSAMQMAVLRDRGHVIRLWKETVAGSEDLRGRSATPEEAGRSASQVVVHLAQEIVMKNKRTKIVADRGAVVVNASRVRGSRLATSRQQPSADTRELEAEMQRFAALLEAARAEHREEVELLRHRLNEVAGLAEKPKAERNPRVVRLSGRGLVEAAKAVGEIVPGLCTAAQRIVALLGGPA
jgi:hypothetical protein